MPFIARWPGKIPKGRIDKTTPITAVDLLPTLCSIAGAKLPKGYVPDGVDQSKALFGKATSTREKPIYWQWKTASRRGDNWPTLAVREGTRKLLLAKQATRIELFRFPEDRLEKNNLVRVKPDEVRRLRTLLDVWITTLPAKPKPSCFSSQRSR